MIKIKKQLLEEVLKIFQFPYNSDIYIIKSTSVRAIPAVISREAKPHFVNRSNLHKPGAQIENNNVEESVIN